MAENSNNRESFRSPKEKYDNDAEYKQAVDLMTSLIANARFRPSEMREMATLASIHYELHYGFRYLYTVPMEIKNALQKLENYRKSKLS